MNVVTLAEVTKSALAMMPDTKKELPYEGAKEMLFVENVDDREFLQDLVQAMVEELPAVRKKKTCGDGGIDVKGLIGGCIEGFVQQGFARVIVKRYQ